MNEELYNLIRSKDHDFSASSFEVFAKKIRETHPEHIKAILVYGSKLSETMITKTSTPDFYVVVDDYKSFHKTWKHRFLNRHLPPNIYHSQIDEEQFKFCVISYPHLKKETGFCAKDVYHLGRFSKRMGLLWISNPHEEDSIVDIQIQAVISVAKRVLQSMNRPISIDEFIQKSLFLSYQGDVRIEASDKIQKIMDSEKDYYVDLFKLALDHIGVQKTDSGYLIQKSIVEKLVDQTRFSIFIFRSRVRALLRWFKNMLTVKNWLDYILAKIERTQGIKIELTPFQRRFWFIFGWKHFINLYRKKLIK